MTISVLVEGREVLIPYRVHDLAASETTVSHAPERARLERLCHDSRHVDGHVRERCARLLMSEHDPLAAPYILQLASEYVIEILNVIYTGFESCNRESLRRFLADNPAFHAKARQRMISYWDCYHRRWFPRSTDYVGYKLFAEFDLLRPGAMRG